MKRFLIFLKVLRGLRYNVAQIYTQKTSLDPQRNDKIWMLQRVTLESPFYKWNLFKNRKS